MSTLRARYTNGAVRRKSLLDQCRLDAEQRPDRCRATGGIGDELGVRVDRGGVDRHRERDAVPVEDAPPFGGKLDPSDALLRSQILERLGLHDLEMHHTAGDGEQRERHHAEKREESERWPGAAASHGVPGYRPPRPGGAVGSLELTVGAGELGEALGLASGT